MKLFEPRPVFTSRDGAHGSCANPVLRGNFLVPPSLAARAISFCSDSPNLSLFQLGVGMGFPANHPALSFGILDIFNVRSKEKMGGIETGGVVAPVEDVQPIWDGAVLDLPRQPVGYDNHSFSIASHPNAPVAKMIARARELYAARWRRLRSLVKSAPVTAKLVAIPRGLKRLAAVPTWLHWKYFWGPENTVHGPVVSYGCG